MKGFLAKGFLASCVFAALAFSARAEEPLALSAEPPVQAASPSSAELDISPVVAAPLPNVSAESLGVRTAEGLGADMWGSTDRGVAEALLALVSPSNSPVLNRLVLRLLKTAAVPPEGSTASPSELTSLRVKKLAVFGYPAEAWSLARQARGELIDDPAYRFVAETAHLAGDKSVCGQARDIAKARPQTDWQDLLVVCLLHAKENAAAQVALDIAQAEKARDKVFFALVDKNVLGGSNALPDKLLPVTPLVLDLLKLANKPLSEAFFAQADFSFAPIVAALPAQKSEARLDYAERAVERGLLAPSALAKLYAEEIFSAEVLASPLASKEKGPRLRALLFRAAGEAKEASDRAALALKFAESASASLLAAAAAVPAQMAGAVAPDSSMGKDAAALAHIYMLAGNAPFAEAWFDAAKLLPEARESLRALWPQFALAGFIGEGAWGSDLARWLDGWSGNADAATVRDVAIPSLLLMDAAGLTVPESAWRKFLPLSMEAKRAEFSPLLLERVKAAALAQRRAETVLLATLLLGEKAPSPPVAIAIASALYEAGFDDEAALFARQEIARLAKGK